MIIIRSPIRIQTAGESKVEVDRVRQLFDADAAKSCQPGFKIDDLFLVGPRNNETVVNLWKRFSSLPGGDGIVLETNAIAWGAWMPLEVEPLKAPLVQVFRHVENLGDRPVLIAENRLQPGELIVVAEDCDCFVTLLPYQEETLPPDIKWFAWVSHQKRETARVVTDKRSAATKRAIEPATESVNFGPVVRAPSPWLTDINSDIQFALTPETPSFQLTPMLPPCECEALAKAMTNAPWTRRIGEIYSQDSLDIDRWSQTDGCPEIVKQAIKRLRDPALVKRVARLTGISVTAQRELFSYRFHRGDRILNHADTTCDGQLMVRMNWLLQVPTSPLRQWDFRFWNPDYPEIPPVVYSSQPNRAVFFLMGEDTPHDITPIPDGACDRINIVMTFGRVKQRV